FFAFAILGTLAPFEVGAAATAPPTVMTRSRSCAYTYVDIRSSVGLTEDGMRVAVLGAGVVGVTTAYELARDGHEVVVIDRLPEAAGETSFANAGLIAPGHAYTWSSPRAPRILLKSLFDKSQALQFKPSLDPRLWSWSWKFLANCTAERARTN